MKLKLKRDIVISVVRGKDLVGVYAIYPEAKDTRNCARIGHYHEELLAEFSPEKADAIIKLWNK
jgi:glutathione synthase/RimK-type ligase-like ATP-grasp enzyme